MAHRRHPRTNPRASLKPGSRRSTSYDASAPCRGCHLSSEPAGSSRAVHHLRGREFAVAAPGGERRPATSLQLARGSRPFVVPDYFDLPFDLPPFGAAWLSALAAAVFEFLLVFLLDRTLLAAFAAFAPVCRCFAIVYTSFNEMAFTPRYA